MINGRAFLNGDPPPEKALPLDPNCGKLLLQQHVPTTRFYVVANDHGLGDVYVRISSGLRQREWPVPEEPYVIQQQGCIYTPYIGAARAGQKIQILNLDPALHNVHPTPTVAGNPESNRAQLPNGKPLEMVFPHPEMFLRFKCDVHPWMFSYVSLEDHPFFAVTDETGHFRISGLPAGRYTIEAYHRKAGKLAQPIEIKGNEAIPVQFVFDLPVEAQAQLQQALNP